MIPRSQIKRIIDGGETTFVRFELKIIFVFSVQNRVIDNKHEVSIAKIGVKGKPDYAADHILDRQCVSRLAELSYLRNISFRDMRVTIETATINTHIREPHIFRQHFLLFAHVSSFFFFDLSKYFIQLQKSQGILHDFDRHGHCDRKVAHFIHHGSYCVGLAGCDGIDHIKSHACMLLVRAFL